METGNVECVTQSRTTTWVATGVVISFIVGALLSFLLFGNDRREPPDGSETDLSADVHRFAEGMSRESGYTKPSHTERTAVGDGVRDVLDGIFRDAEVKLGTVGYALRKRVDTATERVFYELSDTRRRGWGRVLVDIGATVQLGIEIPHPKADQDTDLLGVELFRRVPGSVLVIAGAHRRAAPDRQADMAHVHGSVFETVHELVVQRRIPVVQLHGFQNETAPDSDVVVSAGPPLHSSYAARIARQLESAGLDVCEPWVTGCPELEGTTNVQARWSAEHGGDFAHVEVSRDVRDSAESRARVVSALAEQVIIP